jgi:hypothetical protein
MRRLIPIAAAMLLVFSSSSLSFAGEDEVYGEIGKAQMMARSERASNEEMTGRDFSSPRMRAQGKIKSTGERAKVKQKKMKKRKARR